MLGELPNKPLHLTAAREAAGPQPINRISNAYEARIERAQQKNG